MIETISKPTYFLCSKCNRQVQLPEPGTTCAAGYATNDKEEKICYECCAAEDKNWMIEKGKIALYLVKEDNGQYKIKNWPGTLSFPIFGGGSPRKSWHNIARNRYDCWFVGPDMHIWHAVQYGDNTQIAHCKRTREKHKTF